jgi:hypothetical protein
MKALTSFLSLQLSKSLPIILGFLCLDGLIIKLIYVVLKK